jgi:hypothetical protein
MNFEEVNDKVDDKSGYQIPVPTAWTPDDKKTQMVKINLIKENNRDGRYRLFYKFRQV